MSLVLGNQWDELLKEEFEKDYYKQLREFLIQEYKENTVYPKAEDIFNALKLTDYKDVKAVILGQDPYHEPGQAQGLAFSVPRDVQYPPSLVNIFKELASDQGIEVEKECSRGENNKSFRTAFNDATCSDGVEDGAGCNAIDEVVNCDGIENGANCDGVLVPWAERGVLLLNTVLTVRAHQAGSHRGRGWEQFTDAVIKLLSARPQPMVFILWGANAISKKELILEESSRAGARHLIITAPHPSPLSAYRGFFGGRYFSRTNYFLEDSGLEPIDWSL